MTQEAAAPTLREALEKINDWVCYASEEDVNAKPMAMQQIGVIARAALAARPADPVEPSDAQIAAFLKTNDAYWHETDQELPNKPGQWRNGNVKEATRVSLRAALATPAEPSVRAALEGLLAHCAAQGWWMKVHAVAVMDAARAALQETR